MKILIVDDSMTSRMFFKTHMSKEGRYEIFEAGNLPDALAMASKVQPELVVMDYNMPEYNGVEMAQALWQAGLKAKIVMLTANTQKTVVDSAMAAGFSLVMEKPLNASKIATILAQVN